MLELSSYNHGFITKKIISTNSTAKIRTSRQRSLEKNVFLEILQSSQEKTCSRAFFYKVAGLRPKKFLRTPFLQNTSGRLLLKNKYQTFKNLFQIFLIYEFPFRKAGESFIVSLFFVPVVKQYISSPSEVFCLKDILKNFAKFTGKHLCQSLF